jgi:mRNA interferase MazF
MAYVPDRGDVVWLTFDPQLGREQAGRRPALVLSSVIYNRPSRLAVFCPITNQAKGYPFEVALPDGFGVTGVVLVDHIKNLDWNLRQANFLTRVPNDVMARVESKLRALLGV